MSECVVRIEMPEDCFECPFGIIDCTESGVWCNALSQQSSGQREDCPIVCALPEWHGRLVDADALIELMLERKQPLLGADSSKDRYRYMQWVADFNAICEEMKKPIVPAERRPNGEGD